MLLTRRTDASTGVVYYVSPLLEQAGIPHAFSTRIGGVSPPPFDSLNLGTVGGSDVQDDLTNIRENYRRLRAAIGCGERDRCWVHQVHGAEVCAIRPGEAFESGVKADALVTTDAGRVLSVKYADCVPILLATKDGRGVAAVHAGWRGVVAGVVPAAVKRLGEVTGASVDDVIAAVGPCIGVEHFEVGAEVVAAFREAFPGVTGLIRLREGEKAHVDLAEAVRRQLLGVGVREGNLDTTDRCTVRDRGEFFSHRRDRGVTGRMAAIIGARAR